MLVQDRNELEALMGHHAYIHPSEMGPFCIWLSQCQHYLEIGTGYGATAALALLHAPDTATVVSIDPFVKDTHGDWTASQEEANKAVRQVLEGKGKIEALTRWTLIKAYSKSVAPFWKMPIDLLFIDGDHRYEAVREDVDLWLDKVSPGGLIVLHDSRQPADCSPEKFDQGWPGPTRVANELRNDPRVTLEAEVYSITAWRK